MAFFGCYIVENGAMVFSCQWKLDEQLWKTLDTRLQLNSSVRLSLSVYKNYLYNSLIHQRVKVKPLLGCMNRVFVLLYVAFYNMQATETIVWCCAEKYQCNICTLQVGKCTWYSLSLSVYNFIKLYGFIRIYIHIVTSLPYVNQMKEAAYIPNKINITYYLSILSWKKNPHEWYSEWLMFTVWGE